MTVNGIVGVMKRVAENEVQRIYTTELGVVTAVFPHAAKDDKDNYHCSVKLKNMKLANGKELELRKVPIATPYMGMACIPNVGDLVLLSFVGGDINAPIVIGRLYNDKDRPPENKKNEFLIQHKLKDGGSIKLDKDGKIIATSKDEKSVVTVEDKNIVAENEKCALEIKEGNVKLKNEKCELEFKEADVTLKNEKCTLSMKGSDTSFKNDKCTISQKGGNTTIKNAQCTISLEGGNITIKSGPAGNIAVTAGAGGKIKIDGPAAPGSIEIGKISAKGAVGDDDMMILSMHQHVGNLGAPCPIMVPMEKVNSIQAKLRNTKVG